MIRWMRLNINEMNPRYHVHVVDIDLNLENVTFQALPIVCNKIGYMYM